MRGRKPKPFALKVLQGNPGHQSLNDNAPQFPGGIGPCPKWMTKEAKAEWRRIVKELDGLGLLARVDRDSLAAYCVCLVQWRECMDFVEKNGKVIVFRNDKGEIKYTQTAPQAVLAMKLLDQLKSIGSEFGLSPLSRGRLSVPKTKRQSLKDSIMAGSPSRARSNSA